MNDSKNSSKGLLVLKVPQVLGKETVDKLTDYIAPIADQLGLEPMVLDGGADIRIEKGTDALLERVCVALEEIAAQGRMPEVNVAEIAPQALNARSSGLNSRPSAPTFNVVEDASKAGLTRVRTLDSGEQVIDVFVKDLLGG